MWSSVARWPKNASKNGESSKQTKICKDFYRFLFWHGRCTWIRSQIRTYLEIQAQVKGPQVVLGSCAGSCAAMYVEATKSDFTTFLKPETYLLILEETTSIEPTMSGFHVRWKILEESSILKHQDGRVSVHDKQATPTARWERWLPGWWDEGSWVDMLKLRSVSRKNWFKDKRYDKWCVFEKTIRRIAT